MSPTATATKTVTIRHAVFRWRTSDDPPRTELAVRGQAVEIPRSEYDRAMSLSPVTDPPFVPEDTVLAPAGEMTPITAEASEAEFVAWVGAATGADIAQLLVDQPATSDKIGGAMRYLVQTRTPSVVAPVIPGLTVQAPYPAGQHPVEAAHAAAAAGQTLGPRDFGYGADDPSWNPLDPTPAPPTSGLPVTGVRVPGAAPEELFGAPSDTPPTPGSAPDVQEHANDPLTGSEPSGGGEVPTSAAEAVQGNVAQVSAYLQANPDQAQAVLDAETARVDAARTAGDTRAEFRKGVSLAAQAAAGHTNV
jgi:hypothetical protein